MKRHALTSFIVLAACAAQADLLYDNGGPNLLNGNEMSSWLQAENFTVASSASANSVRFFTIEDGTWDGTLDWWIFNDNAGVPGAIVNSGAATNINRVATGNIALGIYAEYEWTFNIASTALNSATTYYLGLRSAGSSGMYWETTSNGTGPAGVESFGGSMNNWSTNFAEHSFEIHGAVPEPGTFVALAGFASLALLRRRRSR